MNKRLLILTLWLTATVLIQVFVKPDSVIPNLKPLDNIPLNIKNWHGEKSNLSASQDMLKYRIENSYDEFILRNYIDDTGFKVEVQVFYCNSRIPRNRLTGTLNKINCLHGHFYFLNELKTEITENAKASMLYLGRNGIESIVIYWLQSKGKTSSTGNEHLIWQYKQSLKYKRTDGCFVKIAYYGTQTPEKNHKLQIFAKLLHAEVDRWLGENLPKSYSN